MKKVSSPASTGVTASPESFRSPEPPPEHRLPLGGPKHHSWRFFIPPVFSMLAALGSMAPATLLGQYHIGLAIAFLAIFGSIAGLVFLLLKKTSGISIHLAAAGMSVAAMLVAINTIALKHSLELNSKLHSENESTAQRAKATLDEAEKKHALAEEAPKRAEQLLKAAKELQGQNEAAEKKAMESLLKANETENQNRLDRKKNMDDKAIQRTCDNCGYSQFFSAKIVGLVS